MLRKDVILPHSNPNPLPAATLKRKTPQTFRDYYKTCEGLVAQFGCERLDKDLRPDDFRKFRTKLAERFSVAGLKSKINRIFVVFNFAQENSLVEEPVTGG